MSTKLDSRHETSNHYRYAPEAPRQEKYYVALEP